MVSRWVSGGSWTMEQEIKANDPAPFYCGPLCVALVREVCRENQRFHIADNRGSLQGEELLRHGLQHSPDCP